MFHGFTILNFETKKLKKNINLTIILNNMFFLLSLKNLCLCAIVSVRSPCPTVPSLHLSLPVCLYLPAPTPLYCLYLCFLQTTLLPNLLSLR